MIDIEDYIKEQLVPNLLVEFQRDLIVSGYSNRKSLDILKIFERILYKTGYDVSNEEVSMFIRPSNNSVTILCLKAFHLISGNDYDEGKRYMDFSVEIATGKLKHYLEQISLFIYLSDIPKSNGSSIIKDLKRFLKFFLSNSYTLSEFLWDINNSISDDLSEDEYHEICSTMLSKNSNESDLFFYKFYILTHFKNWEVLIQTTKEFLQKFPERDASTVYFYLGDAYYHLGLYISATKAYRNSIESSTGDEYESTLSNALAYKKWGICYVKLARQRKISGNSNTDLIGWYEKADQKFKKALPYIDNCDKELFEFSLQSSLIIAASGNVN